jgi:hypothetical protein
METKSSHCSLHRHALVVRVMLNSFISVLDNAVQIVNFIKARPINSRMFKLLCYDVGCEYETLIFHPKVRWLSRGKVMMTVFQLRMKLQFLFI